MAEAGNLVCFWSWPFLNKKQSTTFAYLQRWSTTEEDEGEEDMRFRLVTSGDIFPMGGTDSLIGPIRSFRIIPNCTTIINRIIMAEVVAIHLSDAVAIIS